VRKHLDRRDYLGNMKVYRLTKDGYGFHGDPKIGFFSRLFIFPCSRILARRKSPYNSSPVILSLIFPFKISLMRIFFDVLCYLNILRQQKKNTIREENNRRSSIR